MDFGGSGDINIGVGGDISPLKQALDQIPALARQAGEAAAAALSSAASSGGGTATAFADAARATQQLSEAMNTAVGAAQQLDRELQQKPTDAGNATMAFKDLGQSLTEAGGALVMIGGILSTISAGFIDLGVEALSASAKIETQRIAMVNLTKSAEQTDTLIKGLVDFAVKTPFQIPGVIEMGQKLVAMGTAAQDVIPLLRTLGDTASGSGKGFAGLNTLVQDFGKMAQLGVVHMRELNVLAYQGVPAIQALADAFGVSANRMRQMVEQNMVAAADAIPILLKAMNEKFGGQMEAQSKGLEGMFSNLKDAVIRTLIAIGDALAPAAKGIINSLMPIVDEIARMAKAFGELPQWVQQTAIVMGVLVVALGPVILGVGAIVFAVGQTVIAAQTLAPIIGVELPAAFTRGTIAVAENTIALEANAVAARTAGAALGTTAAEGAGIAATAFGTLRAAASLAIPIIAAVATAFVAGKLIASILETIPYVQTLQKAWADTALAQTGAAGNAQAQGAAAYFKAISEGSKGAAAGLDLAARGLKLLQDAQSDANQAVITAKGVMDAAKAALDGSAEAAAVYRRSVNAYNDAVEKASATIKTHGSALKDATIYTSEAGAALDKYSGIVGKVTGFVNDSMVEFRRAIIDGMNPATAIKELDELIAKMRALATDGDTVAGGLADMFEGSRKKIIDMLLSLDPTKMQAFNINGVQVLKQGISGLGLSTDEMKTKLATALGITEDAAAKLINAWKTGMRDAGASTDGFTHTVINGVEVITPALKSLKGSIDAVSDSARANAESMIFMGDKWVSASELGKKVAQTVGSYEAPFKAATGATAEQTKALDSLMMSAKEFQRVYGGSMEDARAVTSKAGKAWEDASVSAKMFGSDLKTMEGSFMEGMKGMTVSGEVYIAMLSQMGALQSDVARAAAALGYEEIGINNFVSPEFKKNYQGGATQALLDQMDKYFQDKIAADAKALEAHTASVEAATHKYDDLMIMVNGVMMSIKDYNELAKKVADDANKHQLESLGELTIGSKEASDAIGDLANASTLAAGNLGTITNNVSSTADMWRSFPDQMATAQSQTIKNLLDLGTNFYDAVDAANNLVDGFDEAAAKIQRSGSIGTISDVTSGSPQSYDATFKNLLNLGMNFYDAKDAINRMVQGADEAAMKLPQSAQIMKTTVDSTVGSLLKLGMNFYDAVDATRNLVIGFDKATAVLNPTASIGRGNPIFPDSQYQLGISGAYRTGDVSAGTGLMGLRAAGSGVTINVTGNTIMDQGTVNSLTNRVATQMTNILRMNAGLKV